MHLSSTASRETPLPVDRHHPRTVPTGRIVADEPLFVELDDEGSDHEVELDGDGGRCERLTALNVGAEHPCRVDDSSLQGDGVSMAVVEAAQGGRTEFSASPSKIDSV